MLLASHIAAVLSAAAVRSYRPAAGRIGMFTRDQRVSLGRSTVEKRWNCNEWKPD